MFFPPIIIMDYDPRDAALLIIQLRPKGLKVVS